MGGNLRHFRPLHHSDPFDRLILAQVILAQATLAQALDEQMPIPTSDPDFRRYPVDLIRCGE